VSIFKRAEVWILLVLTVAGLVFVLLQDKGDTEDGLDAKTEKVSSDIKSPKEKGDPNPKPEKSDLPAGGVIEVEKIEVKRDSDRFLTKVFISYDNRSDEAVAAVDDAKLVTASGKLLPFFFLAFEGAPPELPAGEKTNTPLMFVVPVDDLAGDLTLEIAGDRVPIKTGEGFDPTTIAADGPSTFKSLEW